VDLMWPAVDEETSRALGNGDWQPSLLWADVVELLEQVQAAGSRKCQITSDGRPPAARAADGR
jgi:hypothetical protein